MRKLGRQHGFYFADDEEESFLVDWLFETLADLNGTKAYRRYIADEENEEEDDKAVMDFAKFNDQIEAKLTEKGCKFFGGNRLTIADFALASIYLRFVYNETSTKPVVARIRATVEETSVVEAYIFRFKKEMASYMAEREDKPM